MVINYSDLKNESDEGLENLLAGVQQEQARRQALNNIPELIQNLKSEYVDGGGNPSDLP